MYFLLALLKCLLGIVLAVAGTALVLLVIAFVVYAFVYGLEYFGIIMSNPLKRMYYGFVERLPKRKQPIDKDSDK